MGTLLRAVIDSTGLSRRKAFAAIREGRVSVAGVAVIDPSSAYENGAIELDNAPLVAASAAKTYILLNKPPGFITTTADEQGRRTVIDLVPPALRVPGLHPIGRLDRDTSGLLILTNDGDLTFRLSHPSHEIEKEYWVRLVEPPDAALLDAVRDGVEIDGGVRKPLRIRRLDRAGGFDVAVTIREGRKRQVRRMFAANGGEVSKLRRVREGPLLLGELPEGAVRALTQAELECLRAE